MKAKVVFLNKLAENRKHLFEVQLTKKRKGAETVLKKAGIPASKRVKNTFYADSIYELVDAVNAVIINLDEERIINIRVNYILDDYLDSNLYYDKGYTVYNYGREKAVEQIRIIKGVVKTFVEIGEYLLPQRKKLIMGYLLSPNGGNIVPSYTVCHINFVNYVRTVAEEFFRIIREKHGVKVKDLTLFDLLGNETVCRAVLDKECLENSHA